MCYPFFLSFHGASLHPSLPCAWDPVPPGWRGRVAAPPRARHPQVPLRAQWRHGNPPPFEATAETCPCISAGKKTVIFHVGEPFFPKQLWSWMGFSILPRNRFCSSIISGFWLGFRGLSPYSFGILFHHHFLVPARVPGLVSLLFWHPVPSSFPGSC